ncbi:AzlD domain-containing protein [Oxobacter pfennigii]|nr:AzlD domain-containing protein [Oxobacter pfennigii]
MNNKTTLLILGMTAVTFIPRLLPFIIISSKKLPENIRRFLLYIPYAALGALIIPGVFTATPSKSYAAIVGMVFAALFSWYKGGIIIPVLGSMIITYIVLLI